MRFGARLALAQAVQHPVAGVQVLVGGEAEAGVGVGGSGGQGPLHRRLGELEHLCRGGEGRRAAGGSGGHLGGGRPAAGRPGGGEDGLGGGETGDRHPEW